MLNRINRALKNGMQKLAGNHAGQPAIVPRPKLSTLFDSMANVLDETVGSDQMKALVLTDSLKWLAKKQAKFSGDAYLDQLERNTVYFRESAAVCDLALAHYLHDGEPMLPVDQVRPFVISQKEISLSTSRDQMKFLREGCADCGSHWRHPLWQWMKEARQQLERGAYLELMEESSLLYCGNYTTSEQFLLAFLQNHQLGGVAREEGVKELWDLADNRSLVWASIWSGNMKVNMRWERDLHGVGQWVHEEPPAKQPTWRDLWGDQFDAIARGLPKL